MGRVVIEINNKGVWCDVSTFFVRVFDKEVIKAAFPQVVNDDMTNLFLQCAYWVKDNSYHYDLVWEPQQKSGEILQEEMNVAHLVDTEHMNAVLDQLMVAYQNEKGAKIAIAEKGGWLDDVTFLVSVYERNLLEDALGDFGVIEEGEEVHLECEYHEDENDYHYTLVFEDDNIVINHLVNSDYMNKQLDSLTGRK